MPKKLTTKEFIKRAITVHGARYDYSSVKYKGSKDIVIIKCILHKEQKVMASRHLEGQGCRECTSKRTKLEGNEDIPINSKAIPLTHGKYAIVDEEDYERVSQYNWHFKGGYAINDEVGRMHRFILNVIDPRVFIDHKFHNGLDNRKQNIRIATPAQNSYNKKPRITSSMYKGVFKVGDKKWRATIKYLKKDINIGIFTREIWAAQAYDEKASELFKEFAYLNFPNVG